MALISWIGIERTYSRIFPSMGMVHNCTLCKILRTNLSNLDNLQTYRHSMQLFVILSFRALTELSSWYLDPQMVMGTGFSVQKLETCHQAPMACDPSLAFLKLSPSDRCLRNFLLPDAFPDPVALICDPCHHVVLFLQ